MLAKLLKPYKKMELTYTSYSSSTDEELDEIILPSGIQSGDLIVLYCESINTSGTPTDSTPSGFIKFISSWYKLFKKYYVNDIVFDKHYNLNINYLYIYTKYLRAIHKACIAQIY